MNTDNRAVDGDFPKVALLSQFREDFLPNSLVGPSTETPIDAVPRAEFLRQVSPRETCSCDVQDRLNKLSVVKATTHRVAPFAGEKRFDMLPMVFFQEESECHRKHFVADMKNHAKMSSKG